MTEKYNDGFTHHLERSFSLTTDDICHCNRGGVRSKEANTEQKQKRRPLYSTIKAYILKISNNHLIQGSSHSQQDVNKLLLSPPPRQQWCGSLWWKPLMWTGVILLLFGVLMILVGNLIPPLHVFIESSDDPNDTDHVDRKAEEYNTILGMWEFIGLILFCVGGGTMITSLLVPAFLNHFCRNQVDCLEVRNQRCTRIAAFNPFEVAVPISSTINDVQSTKFLNSDILKL